MVDVPSVNELSGLFETQPDPAGPVPLITAGLVVLVVLSRMLWRLARNVITVVHEAGHALVALCVGRRLHGIRLHSDTSGVTVSRGKPQGPGMVLTALAGYLAPALLGLGFAALLMASRISTLLIVIALLLVGVLIMIRNVYGAFAVIVLAAGLAMIAFLAGPGLQAWFGYLITWFLLIGSVRPVFELQAKRGRGGARDSDADQLARLTGVPGWTWVMVFAAVSLGCLVLGGSWLVEPALR